MERFLTRLFLLVSLVSISGDTVKGLVVGRAYSTFGIRACFEKEVAQHLAEFASDHQGSSTLFYILKGARQCGDWRGRFKVTRHVGYYFNWWTGHSFYVFEFRGVSQGFQRTFYGVTTYNIL